MSCANCTQPVFKSNLCIDHYRKLADSEKGGSSLTTPATAQTSSGKQGQAGVVPEAKLNEYRAKFAELTKQSIDDQVELFLKSFIFELGDNWKKINELQKLFIKRCADANEGKNDLNPVMAADFLQKNGRERTALERKEEVADIDLDRNDRIAFIEYLLLHFKVMVIQSYFKRHEANCPYDLSKDGIGVTGVGPILLEELFTMPVGLSPELIAAIEEFTKQKKARKAKVDALTATAALGGVKGLAATNELKQMETEDQTPINRVELTLQAAQRKAATQSGDIALKQKKDAVMKEAAEKAAASRANLKAKAALWEQNKPS